MEHQSFRYYIPGIIFLAPIYIVISWIVISSSTEQSTLIVLLLAGIAIFPAISLPIGWWIHNIYHVGWIIFTKGGYENKDFMELIRKEIKPFYSPLAQSILINFSLIKETKSWIKFDLDIFRKTFYPFTSNAKFRQEIEQIGVSPKFLEPLSDNVLFKDSAYDYARSISTIRYGLESSLFAIVISAIYSAGIMIIWCFPSVVISIVCCTILVLLSIFLIILLINHWRRACREYDARLNLITMISISSNYFSVNVFKDKIPKEIVEKICQLKLTGQSYAAFDLDGTLLNHDIGEAVFASLIRNKIVEGFDWNDYIKLLKTDRKTAYKKVIDEMAGIDLNKLKSVTHEVINSTDENIIINGETISIPKPNLIMQAIVSLLKTMGIEVYVVTASNTVSAEIICWKHFGIPSSHVFGATVETNSKGKIISSSTEIPYAEAKVAVIKNKIAGQPLITGGDGVWDCHLLDYTKPGGIRFWLGKDNAEYQNLKEKFYKDLDFYQIQKQ